MIHLLIFAILSLPVVIISWRTLYNLKSHGFYRFFSWECIVLVLVVNYRFWFVNPISIMHIFSWIFLILSGYLIITGANLIKKVGKPDENRNEKTLYKFEKTSELIDYGIYKYIRHPLYSSLLFLTWGIALKNITEPTLIISFLSTGFLYLTAIFDEKECIIFFGDKYKMYMKHSKRFIPFIF